jgi:hypothetical protein
MGFHFKTVSTLTENTKLVNNLMLKREWRNW